MAPRVRGKVGARLRLEVGGAGSGITKLDKKVGRPYSPAQYLMITLRPLLRLMLRLMCMF